MADTLSLTLEAFVKWRYADTLDLSSVVDTSSMEYEQDLTDGTGANQADKFWHDTLSIGVNASVDLQLDALTQSIFGSTVTITLVKVKGIFIINNLTTAGDELIVGGGTNPFLKPWNDVTNAREFIGPGGMWFNSNPVDGWTVTGSSNDNLRIANPSGNSGTAAPKILIWGTSA